MILLTQVNASTVNLAYHEEWEEGNGVRIRHWTSGWKEAWYSLESNGAFNLREEERSLIGGANTGQKRKTVDKTIPRTHYRWHIGPATFVRLNLPLSSNALNLEKPLKRSQSPGLNEQMP